MLTDPFCLLSKPEQPQKGNAKVINFGDIFYILNFADLKNA